MSRRYEFLEDGVEVLTPQEVDDNHVFEVFPLDADQVALVLGNPYATAGVLVGTRERLQARLQEWIDLLKK